MPIHKPLALVALLLAWSVSARDETYLPKSPAPVRRPQFVNTQGLRADERTALTCLQGLTARTQPSIWLVRHKEDRFWLEWHKTKGHIADYEEVADWTELFRKYSGAFKGAVIPDDKFYRGDLIAVNVAACEDLIVTSPRLAEKLQLPVKVDLRERFTNYADGLRWLWNTYRDRFSRRLCDYRQPELLKYGTFDYSLQWRAPMFWIGGKNEDGKPGVDIPAEKEIVSTILAAMAPNSVCIGFPGGTVKGGGIGEVRGVELLSRYGHALVCNNHMANYSVLSGFRVEEFSQPKQAPAPALQRDKIYIALVMSDGDNQILWPNFFRRYFEHPALGKFPLAFGIGPAIRELEPGIAQWYFERATPTTEFICDVSGAGYMQPDKFATERPDRDQVFAKFLDWTARLMQPLGLRSIRTVKGGEESVIRYAKALPFCHSIFADMGRYSGKSGITNLTYSLPSGMPVFRSVTSWRYGKDGFLREVREQVGTVRPAFVNGFVHCWTFGMDELVKIHEQRDADMVFVTPTQLAALYQQGKTK